VTAQVVVAGERPSGLAEMLAGLLRSNLERHPGRRVLLRPATIVVAARDAGVSVGLRLERGRVTLTDGNTSRRDVVISAASGDLLALASAPLRLGFPDPFDRRGRTVLREIVSGRVRIDGLLRHPVLVSRFARLLSVA
jgi:hypothetical protein